MARISRYQEETTTHVEADREDASRVYAMLNSKKNLRRNTR
jgi:hypothetical protein